MSVEISESTRNRRRIFSFVYQTTLRTLSPWSDPLISTSFNFSSLSLADDLPFVNSFQSVIFHTNLRQRNENNNATILYNMTTPSIRNRKSSMLYNAHAPLRLLFEIHIRHVVSIIFPNNIGTGIAARITNNIDTGIAARITNNW